MLKIILLSFLSFYFTSSLDICKSPGKSYRLNNEITSAVSILKNTLQQLNDDSENLTKDVILGVIFTKANLQWSIEYLSSNFQNYELIYELKYLTDYSDSIVKDFFARSNDKIKVLDQDIWDNSARNLKKDFLDHNVEPAILPDVGNCSSVEEFLMRGSMNDSDLCISELFSDNCEVSDKCWYDETSETPHSGYITTHRLLYMQIAERVQCNFKNPEKFSTSKTSIQKLCSQILSEASAFEKIDYPFILRDLFLEQIALCGLEGHTEFAKQSWRDKLISWQTEMGCFDTPETNEIVLCSYEKPQGRQKRKDSILSNGCHSHVTSVAISALSFHLRFSISECY